MVTAGDDRTARVWDAYRWRLVSILNGHAGRVSSAAFSDDGKLVVTASVDRTARVWLAETGESVAVLRGHTGQVYDADVRQRRRGVRADAGGRRNGTAVGCRPSLARDHPERRRHVTPRSARTEAASRRTTGSGTRTAAASRRWRVPATSRSALTGSCVFTARGAEVWSAADGRARRRGERAGAPHAVGACRGRQP